MKRQRLPLGKDMNIMKRKHDHIPAAILLVAMTMLLLPLLAGCGGGGEKTEGEGGDELQKIRLCEVTHSVFYAPLYATIENGYFEEEGLEVELINGGGADKVMTAVLSEQAEIGFAGPEACIYTFLEGHDDHPKVFGQLTKRDGSFVMGRTKEEFSWENLRGKKILGGRKGGVPEMTLEYVIKNHGLEPGKDVDVDTSVQFDMMAGAFTGGNGDYVTLFEPTATEVENSGSGYVLASVGEESGEIPYTAFFATQSYLEGNDDVIARFTRAVSKGQKWTAEHSPEEVAKLIAPQFVGTDEKVLTNVVDRYRSIDAWNETLVMKKESLERLQQGMTEAGELEKTVGFDDIVDNSWAEKCN